MNAEASQRTSGQPAGSKGSVRLYAIKSILGTLFAAAMLFIGAGTLNWPGGWFYLGFFIAAQVAIALVLWRFNPDLLAERSTVQKGTKSWDVVVASLATSWFPMAQWLIAGLDARYGWTGHVPPGLRVLGLLLMTLGYALTIWGMAANAFFSATVRIQDDRGHTVVSDGPYRFVRHPGYAGQVVFQIASPLLLGSLWASIPAAISASLYVVRTALEDRTLRAELPGYQDYAERVRYRLIPGIW